MPKLRSNYKSCRYSTMFQITMSQYRPMSQSDSHTGLLSLSLGYCSRSLVVNFHLEYWRILKMSLYSEYLMNIKHSSHEFSFFAVTCRSSKSVWWWRLCDEIPRISTDTHTHTHTRLTALCQGLPGWAGTRKVKTNLDFTEARDSEWQWHQLGRMQVCTSLQTDNHASTPPLSFYRPDALLPPNQQRQSTEGKLRINNNNNDRLTAFDPGQPG